MGVFSSIIFLLFGLIFGILAVLLIVLAFSKFFIKGNGVDFLKENNVAVSILLVSVIISTAILCSSTLMTVQQNISISSRVADNVRTVYVIKTIGFGILQFILSVFMSLLIAFTSTKLYDLMTVNLDEYKEMVHNKNIAVGLVLAGIVFSLTIFIKFPFAALVGKLIPLPQYMIPH